MPFFERKSCRRYKSFPKAYIPGLPQNMRQTVTIYVERYRENVT